MTKPITLSMHHKKGHPAPVVPYCPLLEAWTLPGGRSTRNEEEARTRMEKACMAAGYRKNERKGV